MEIQIEFGGFYGFHDEYIEDRCDTLSIDTDDVNWHKTFVQYSVAWVHRFTDMTGIELFFIGLDSPRYYNYRTDNIMAKVLPDVVQHLMTYINDEFKEWADPQLKSYDGFISFYNGIDDLIERSKDNDDDKAILLGMICNYLIEVMEVNEDIYELEYDIIELTDKTTNNE
jgi:hypothetical protein